MSKSLAASGFLFYSYLGRSVRFCSSRAALGASRFRLIRQLITESVLLALLGGAGGILVTLWGVNILVTLCPSSIPRLENISFDGWVLAFTLCVSLLVGIGFGLAPTLQLAMLRAYKSLKEGGGRLSASLHSSKVQNLLVVSEVALALILLMTAGLMIKSFRTLTTTHPGFSLDDVCTLMLHLPYSQYPQAQHRAEFFQRLLDRIQQLPWVRSVGAVNHIPLVTSRQSLGITIEGQLASTPEEVPIVGRSITTPGYFRAMGIPLLKGRYFNERDVEDSARVVIINETMARTSWHDKNPIGKRLKLGPPRHLRLQGLDVEFPWLSVVGVVGNIKHRLTDAEQQMHMYMPHSQDAVASMRLVIHTVSNPASVVAAVRDQIRVMDKDLPLSDIETMRQIFSDSVSRPRFQALVLGVFAACALVLATLGIYGWSNGAFG